MTHMLGLIMRTFAQLAKSIPRTSSWWQTLPIKTCHWRRRPRMSYTTLFKESRLQASSTVGLQQTRAKWGKRSNKKASIKMMDSRRRLSLVYRIMGWELVLVWASSASEILCWTRGNAAPTSYHHRRANQFWILPGRTWTSCWKGRMLRPNSLSKTKRNCKNIWTLPWSLKRICLVILNTAIQPCVRSTTWRIARQKIAVLAKTRRPTLKTILACTTRQLKTLRMPIPNAIQ